MITINIKQELNQSKQKANKLKNQLSNCYDKELKSHLEYSLNQELLKIESYELLLDLSRKAGVTYE